MTTESFTTDSNDDCTIRWQIQETQVLNSISPHSVKTIIQSGKLQKKFKRPLIYIYIIYINIRKADRSWAKSDLEKVENFAEHLSQVFTPHNSEHHHNNDDIEKFLDAPRQMSLPITAFSPREV
jgi:hypothetical protein